jgi:hypothetical protein
MHYRLRRAPFGLLLALGLAAGEAAAQELCAKLTTPPQLDLFCSPAPGSAPGAVEIAPSGGAFSALSRMTVRPLDREDDALAWSDPAAWLRRQMTLDTSGFAGAVSGLADDPDSPFAGERAESLLENLRSALAEVGTLPLSACDEPAVTEPGRWEMHCNFTAGGLGLLVHQRLVADGDRRWGITMRAANDQRLRHFEAIANSFRPTS